MKVEKSYFLSSIVFLIFIKNMCFSEHEGAKDNSFLLAETISQNGIGGHFICFTPFIMSPFLPRSLFELLASIVCIIIIYLSINQLYLEYQKQNYRSYFIKHGWELQSYTTAPENLASIELLHTRFGWDFRQQNIHLKDLKIEYILTKYNTQNIWVRIYYSYSNKFRFRSQAHHDFIFDQSGHIETKFFSLLSY